MRVVEINGGSSGSTGAIMYGIKEQAEACGHSVICASPVTSTNRPDSKSRQNIKIGTYYGRKISVLLGRITGFHGCFSVFATAKFLGRLTKLKPDLLHLHNLHESYINLPMLFRYIKKQSVPIIWTLHDCWSFTGHCPHFITQKCEKWKTGCGKCPRYKDYPMSCFDNSAMMYRLKKKWFSNICNLTVVTPSVWLYDLVKQSYLGKYSARVINNGIDCSVFKPIEGSFREKYELQAKHIVLGVSFGWWNTKGLDVFCELAGRLPENYAIVLVGTDEATEAMLPSNVVSIRRTQNQSELAEIYTAADVFVNPTREDTYPTVNMEAIACGTPVITFNTGGSPEIIDDTCGSSIECEDVDGLEREIIRICQERPYSKEACQAHAAVFERRNRFKEYVELYEQAVSHNVFK